MDADNEEILLLSSSPEQELEDDYCNPSSQERVGRSNTRMKRSQSASAIGSRFSTSTSSSFSPCMRRCSSKASIATTSIDSTASDAGNWSDRSRSSSATTLGEIALKHGLGKKDATDNRVSTESFSTSNGISRSNEIDSSSSVQTSTLSSSLMPSLSFSSRRSLSFSFPPKPMRDQQSPAGADEDEHMHGTSPSPPISPISLVGHSPLTPAFSTGPRRKRGRSSTFTSEDPRKLLPQPQSQTPLTLPSPTLRSVSSLSRIFGGWNCTEELLSSTSSTISSSNRPSPPACSLPSPRLPHFLSRTSSRERSTTLQTIASQPSTPSHSPSPSLSAARAPLAYATDKPLLIPFSAECAQHIRSVSLTYTPELTSYSAQQCKKVRLALERLNRTGVLPAISSGSSDSTSAPPTPLSPSHAAGLHRSLPFSPAPRSVSASNSVPRSPRLPSIRVVVSVGNASSPSAASTRSRIIVTYADDSKTSIYPEEANEPYDRLLDKIAQHAHVLLNKAASRLRSACQQ